MISVCKPGCLGKALLGTKEIHSIFHKQKIFYTVFQKVTQKEELLKLIPLFSYTKMIDIFLIVQAQVF